MQISYREECKRKLVHLSSLWMVLVILFLPGRWSAAILYAVMLVLNLLCEHAYACNVPVIRPLYGAIFGKMLRDEPRHGQWIVSGSPYVLAAAFLVSLLFGKLPAAAAMTVMLIGDTAAALIGRRFGRHRAPNNKSVEGVVAFIIASWIALAVLFAVCGAAPALYVVGFLAVLPAAAAELFEKQLRLDDNFSIPLIVGLCLELAVRFL